MPSIEYHVLHCHSSIVVVHVCLHVGYHPSLLHLAMPWCVSLRSHRIRKPHKQPMFKAVPKRLPVYAVTPLYSSKQAINQRKREKKRFNLLHPCMAGALQGSSAQL
jgi:hypothetical protein